MQKRKLNTLLDQARQKADFKIVHRISALINLAEGFTPTELAKVLCVSAETIRQWVRAFLREAFESVNPRLKSGRPPKLTKTQKTKLYDAIVAGPQAAGFSGACWRTPMIQQLIQNKFNVTYNVHYLSELLKNMGFSYQRASFVASRRDTESRKKWLSHTWPEIVRKQKKLDAYVLFGDECSFAQWGSLSSTWALKGQTPIVETSGTRKNYKVFGAIDYMSGRFFSQGINGKLNGESYVAFLKKTLRETRKHIILIQDGAPYHKSVHVRAFLDERSDRLTVYTLPSYSPDYNPIEKLWKKIKEGYTHLQYFKTFDDLVNTVENALKDVTSKVKKVIKPLFAMYDNLVKAS